MKHQYFILIYACLAMIHIRNIEAYDSQEGTNTMENPSKS